jgi:hypothetical protein
LRNGCGSSDNRRNRQRISRTYLRRRAVNTKLDLDELMLDAANIVRGNNIAASANI